MRARVASNLRVYRGTEMFVRRWVWILIGLGALLRIRIYLACRSLWTDEAMLALNLIRRPLKNLLLEPLDYQQAAPPGFLAMEKAMVIAFGSGEYSLRLLPLLSGIAAMVLVYLLARQLLNPWATLLAVAMTAFSKGLIEYSVLVKQYEMDVAITLLVLCSAVPMLRTRRWRGWNLFAFGVVAAIAGWISHPAAFTIVGTVWVLLIQQAAHKRWRNAGLIVAASLPAAAGLLIEYLLFLRPLEHSTYLHDFWAAGFLPLPFRLRTSVPWLLTIFVRSMGSPGGYKVWGVAPFGFILGIGSLGRRHLYALPLIMSPIVLAVIAASAQLYPFADRLSLFALPLLFVVTAAGIISLSKWLPTPIGINAARLIALILLAPAIARAGQWMIKPEPMEEIKPVLAYVHDHLKSGDVIYVYRGAEPAFLYYQTRAGLGTARVLLGKDIDPETQRADVSHLAGFSRVWVVISHSDPDGKGSRTKPMMDALKRQGSQLDVITAPGGKAIGYLFDLSKNPLTGQLLPMFDSNPLAQQFSQPSGCRTPHTITSKCLRTTLFRA